MYYVTLYLVMMHFIVTYKLQRQMYNTMHAQDGYKKLEVEAKSNETLGHVSSIKPT